MYTLLLELLDHRLPAGFGSIVGIIDGNLPSFFWPKKV
jgi:hypothetical protein